MRNQQTAEILDCARDMAMLAAERTLDREWREHPMFGINIEKDRWAIAYQERRKKLMGLLQVSDDVETVN